MECNSFPLFYKEHLRTRPQDFIVTDEIVAQVEQGAKKLRAARDLANAKPVDARKEYDQLQGQLFNLKQEVKSIETYVNTTADEVKGIEKRLDNQLKEKKKAAGQGNLRHERHLEQGIVQLETELVDARKESARAQAGSTNAVRALKAFDGYERIAELKKELAL